MKTPIWSEIGTPLIYTYLIYSLKHYLQQPWHRHNLSIHARWLKMWCSYRIETKRWNLVTWMQCDNMDGIHEGIMLNRNNSEGETQILTSVIWNIERKQRRGQNSWILTTELKFSGAEEMGAKWGGPLNDW